ncbi:type I glyceraldehyde-3-phosphate dehydrogenase [Mesonia sp. MT50]|uniref:Glyceraldehyde-3-phosphate dehydrogenase n=1 Tax=Mesonia profundi TaxID=3070998 RepID=A0ABU1A2F4_9FLAO|nr:type I glyceraldehyde-3-phosphate dehydrogenase [Mesonia profundi]MDQ7917815.1 type I glyceraldehyde-3-phosphate dehydrogenase [Mesonia profundi]
MKKINIAINGFGRIGRLTFRIASQREDINIVAINDLVDVEHLAYLLKYDSVHGRFPGDINVNNGNLVVNGKEIRVSAEKNPSELKWDEVNAEVVIDCTGIFKTKESAGQHLKAGAKKVVISAPSKDIPMYVMGVNHKELTAEETIVSNASCTTNCLAVLAKVIEDHYGIEEALMTTVHATTTSQSTVDAPSKKNYRIGRNALANIIPTTTGAALAVGRVIPSLDGKLTGMAFRVPTPDVSVVDLTVRTKKAVAFKELKATLKKASENELKGILGYTDEGVVSQDFVSEPRTSVFDAEASIGLNENFFKLIAWYDNEFGYSSKLVDLATYVTTIK